MKKIIIANWKANPENSAKARALAEATERIAADHPAVEVVVAPPSPFLTEVGAVLAKAVLGSQDAWWTGGPYTGAVSVRQLKSLGVRSVIIGHSERRLYAGETDAMIHKKTAAVLDAGMRAILCVGETDRTDGEMPAMVGEQLRSALAGLKKQLLKRLVIAYEPVWAISTTGGAAGSATPDAAFRARIYIEKTIISLFNTRAARDVRVIYGGSVTPANVASFLSEGNMDGVLVGGQSLDPKKFEEVVRSAADIVRR